MLDTFLATLVAPPTLVSSVFCDGVTRELPGRRVPAFLAPDAAYLAALCTPDETNEPVVPAPDETWSIVFFAPSVKCSLEYLTLVAIKSADHFVLLEMKSLDFLAADFVALIAFLELCPAIDADVKASFLTIEKTVPVDTSTIIMDASSVADLRGDIPGSILRLK